MPNRSSKKEPKDINELAARIVEDATSEDKGEESEQDQRGEESEDTEKNPHAQALGRLGGLKGGKARAAKLSPERRREIARAAAKARWKKSE